MNIVFWLGVFLAAALIWYICLPLFRRLGGTAQSMANEIKELKEEEKEQHHE